MKSVLITGSNRGIGLAIVKYILANNLSSNVIATCRDTTKAEELNALANNHNNLHIFQLDVKDYTKHQILAEQVSKIVKDNGLNLLINNAGIASKFTRIGLVKAEDMAEHFLVNAIGPLMLTKAFLPLLEAASKSNSSLPIGANRAAVVNLSSILGSIASNDQGGFYPYRASKTALNAITKSLSIDLKDHNILVMSLHPGWVKTDMGGPNAQLELDPTAAQIVEFIRTLDLKHNGGFYQYDGKEMAW